MAKGIVNQDGPAFLSDIVGGSVTQDNLDGTLIGPNDMGPYSTRLRNKKYGLQESGIYGTPKNVSTTTK
jgi:hypothetical protein